MKKPFDADVFMGKLLTWIVKTDQSFSIVDNVHFEDMLEYLKKDLTVNCRTTIMARLQEVYNLQKELLKDKLSAISSKMSITCDVWTSKNQLSFFGVTVHFIDSNWKFHNLLIAFKYLEEDHDGISLCNALMNVFEDFEIASRILGITADNASNNTTMLEEMEKIYNEKYPAAGFSLLWNKIECFAHIVNLAGQQILKNFKNPLDVDNYEPDSNSDDLMNTSLSRLSFLVRKIRRSPKIRRLMKRICHEKGMKYMVCLIIILGAYYRCFNSLE